MEHIARPCIGNIASIVLNQDDLASVPAFDNAVQTVE